MLPTIQFNNETLFRTAEVYDVWTDWMLASELEAVDLPRADKIPQASFGVRLVRSQDSSEGSVPLTLAFSS